MLYFSIRRRRIFYSYPIPCCAACWYLKIEELRRIHGTKPFPWRI
jgi:hypothetical protein